MNAVSTAFPGGTVTFLYTEITDRTANWSMPLDKRAPVLERYATRLEDAIVAEGGAVFESQVQIIGAAFASTLTAVRAAATAHRMFARWLGEPTKQPDLRMALHTGVVAEYKGNYIGHPLQWVRLLLAVGHNGQILLSQVTQELVRDQLPAGTLLRDLGAYHLGELRQPEHLFHLEIDGDRADLPPLLPPAKRPNNLPTPSTSLIGREHNVAAVKATLMRKEVRLLTLTGPGGVGKTRLALQAASELQTEFADGIFLCDLGSLRDPALVVPKIAHVLGVSEPGTSSLLVHLSGHLGMKQQLLVLDSFEHLLVAATALGSLLAAAPQLKILVTSQAVLHLAGEHEFPVAPLAVPERGQLFSAAQADAYGAVSLFVQRSKAVKPDLAVTEAELPAIVEICQRLDGLPLAIELAAARCKLFSPQALLDHLGSRLPLLTGGPQDLPARQRTLRATLDWSYKLLNQHIQALFWQLAIFKGGFTLEAAEAVCMSNRDLAGGILDGLTVLIDQSLLHQIRRSSGTARFRMLETIQEYAQERLENSGERLTYNKRHAAYYLKLAEQLEPEMWGSDTRSLLDRCDNEIMNFRAAMSWSLEQGDGLLCAQLASALLVFWDLRHRREGYLWLETALSNSSQLEPTLRAKTLHATAVLARSLNKLEDAQVRFEQSLTLQHELEYESGYAVTVTDLGVMLATLGGDLRRAELLLQEGFERYRELDNSPGMSWAKYGLGWVEVRRVLGAGQEIAWILAELDSTERQPGKLDVARAYFTQCLSLRRSIGEPYHIAWALASLALVAATQGDYDVARALTEERLAIERALDNLYGIAASLQQLGIIVFRQGDIAAAGTVLAEGLAVARERNDTIVTAFALLSLSEVMYSQGRIDRAIELLNEARIQFDELSDRQRLARVYAWQAQLALDKQDQNSASAHASSSISLAREADVPQTIVACLCGLADSAASLGLAGWAAMLWGAAESHQEGENAPLTPITPQKREQLMQGVRAALGEEKFSAVWYAGYKQSPEEVLAAPNWPSLSSPPKWRALPVSSSPSNLTPRQHEVLLLLAQGFSNAEIAAQMVISVATVKAHLTAIYRKLGVSSRTAAIRYMIDHNIT